MTDKVVKGKDRPRSRISRIKAALSSRVASSLNPLFAAFALGSLGLPTTALGASPVVDYKFEDISNGFVHDSSGNGLNGIVRGSLSQVVGVTGQAARFGGDGYIELPKDSRLSIGSGSDMTWIAWIRRDNCLAGGYQRNIPQLAIFSKYNNSGLQLLIPNNSPSFYFAPFLNNQRHIEPVSPMGEWSQIVLIKDDANWWLYQNGVALPGFDTYFNKPGMWGIGNPFPADGNLDPGMDYPMVIGAIIEPYPNSFFKGWMDEIQIYNQALTPSELAALGVSITPGNALNTYTDLLGEAPDNLPSWPWDPGAHPPGYSICSDTCSTVLIFGLACGLLMLWRHRSHCGQS